MNKNMTTSPKQAPQPSQGPAEPGFVKEVLSSLKTSVIATFVLAVIVSGAYPLIVWGLAQVMFHNKANGSLIDKTGKPTNDDTQAVGSALIGQNFSDAKYFHPRPSDAGTGYDATASGGSNLGPTSAKLMFGTTKLVAFTIFVSSDPAHAPVMPVSGRVQATVAGLTEAPLTLTVAGAPGASATTTRYALDPAMADPNNSSPGINFHSRSIHAKTLGAMTGANVELKLSDKTPVMVTTVNVIDQEIDGVPSTIDTAGNKITVPAVKPTDSPTVFNVDKNTVIVLDGKPGAKIADIPKNQTIHAVLSEQPDNSGLADLVVEYCEANHIKYKSSPPYSDYSDADGVDDVKLIDAFNELNKTKVPTVDPERRIPADAVTASGSGLDPHISPANAQIQAQHVADARNMKVEDVMKMIEQHTDGRSLGFLGEPGVNVLRLNLALDQLPAVPAPPATPASGPSSAPSTAPTR